MKIAKYRQQEYPNKWFLTDFTMDQVEKYLATLEAKNRELFSDNADYDQKCSALELEVERLTKEWKEDSDACVKQMSAQMELNGELITLIERLKAEVEALQIELSDAKREVKLQKQLFKHFVNNAVLTSALFTIPEFKGLRDLLEKEE